MIYLYTDGSCDNHHPEKGGGWGVVWRGATIQIIKSGYTKLKTTSVRMEMIAALKALKMISGSTSFTLYADNQLVLDGLQEFVFRWKNNGWLTSEGKPVKNRDLWEKLDNEMSRVYTNGIPRYFYHVKGHSGIEYNELANTLALNALHKRRGVRYNMDIPTKDN